jgi:hypothetical protein
MPHQDTKPDAPSHQPGSRKGESRAKPLAQRPTRLNSDASGINPDDRKPIVKGMPILPPA